MKPLDEDDKYYVLGFGCGVGMVGVDMRSVLLRGLDLCGSRGGDG